MHTVISMRYLGDYRLHLTFNDGREGEVDLSYLLKKGGVFEPLKDIDYFRQVRVDPDLGTICWPNQADICPDTLYAKVTGAVLPECEKAPARASMPETQP